jgi:hypothetical protein
MTADAAAVDSRSAEVPVDLPAETRARILTYLGFLILLLGFGAPYGGLINLPVSFFLKNRLHFSAREVANFGLITGLPLYVSFLFGYVRDAWNPFGMGDRGYLVIFGGLTAVAFAAFAFVPASRETLLVAVLVSTTAYLFAFAAYNGLSSAMGRQHVMSGQVSAVWNVVVSIPTLSAYALGGYLSGLLEGRGATEAARILFLVGAAVMASVALFGLWRPRSVYETLHAERDEAFHPLNDLKRLFTHKPAYVALLIWLLWNFAPGSVTPLQYHLQNKLHASDADWGLWNAIFAAAFIPTFLLYGFLCRRFALRSLLFWGTVVAVPQMVPLLFIHSVPGALVAAAPIGLMGGVSSAAYIDLLIRSCPKGLGGTILMMSNGLYYVASRFGDVLGTNLYDRFGGFGVCVAAITFVYALILPVLWLVPRELTATMDGEVPEGGAF